MIIRGGQPLPIRGTAPAKPAVAVSMALNTLQAFVQHEGRATVWLRVQNTQALIPLMVFFRRRDFEGIAPANYKHYHEILGTTAALAAGAPSFIEGLYELEEMANGGGLYLMGDGGTATFQATLGLRVV